MPPSLHAGLIERGRPRSAAPSVAPAAVPRPQPVLRADEMTEPLSVLTPVKPMTPKPVACAPQPVLVPNTIRMPGLGRRRRFGLTVRVSPETREMLDHLRDKTGQTFQQILHTAVTGHLKRQ